MTTTIAPAPREARSLLDRAEVIWMTTVRADGQPQASPVWFVFDGSVFTMYSRPDAQRVRNIERNPRVSLNLNDDAGMTVVSVEATAEMLEGPLATSDDTVMSKYVEALARMGTTAEWFATTFSQPIRMTPTRWRVEDVS